MPTIELDDIKAAIAAAQAEAEAEALTPEETERAKALAQLADAKAALFASRKARRLIAGTKAEADAKRVAAGHYLVKFIDLGTMLAEADPKTLPGDGVLVVRSPPTEPVDVLAVFATDFEARERPLPDLIVDLLLQSIVYPPNDLKTPEGLAQGAALRSFFESSVGKGAGVTAGGEVQALGGSNRKEAKRGR